MDIIMLLIIALVLCAYFWTGSPKMLKDNKQMLLGLAVGLVLCTFINGNLVEGYWSVNYTDKHNREHTCRGPDPTLDDDGKPRPDPPKRSLMK
tara:strand:+ start:359 stop:637 length:279 start_codon:yes stop_codon:yes gene_type:complete